MNLEVLTAEEFARLLREQTEAIARIVRTSPGIPEWLNDRQCWELKGGMALNTFRSKRYYQPKGGIPDATVGGRRVWNKATVLEWLSVTDDLLPEYHRKYRTGAKK